MRTNTLKQKLREGKAAFGVMITFPSPPVVEMLGYMGFDWMLIDNEHGSITVDTAEDLHRAARADRHGAHRAAGGEQAGGHRAVPGSRRVGRAGSARQHARRRREAAVAA